MSAPTSGAESTVVAASNQDEAAPGSAGAPAQRSPLARAWTGWPGKILRIALAVLPLWWLSRRVNWLTVAHRAVDVGPRGIALALLAGFGTLYVGAVRWRVMLRAYGANPAKIPSTLTLLRHNFVGQYFNVLPSGIAGEAVRGFRVAQCLPSTGDSYLILLVERTVGLIGLLVIAAVAAVALPAMRGGLVGMAMIVGLVLALAMGAVAIGLPHVCQRSPSLRARVGRLPVVGGLLLRLPAPKSYAGVALAVALSVPAQFFIVLTIAALISPLWPAATLGVCAGVVPPIVLATVVPITPGGVGQREAAFERFFALVHVPSEIAVAASVLYFAVLMALSLMGGLALLYERARGL